MADEPSPLARSLAAEMRRFDAGLTDEALTAIAHGIDLQRARGAELAPPAKALPNGLEPLTAVRAADVGA